MRFHEYKRNEVLTGEALVEACIEVSLASHRPPRVVAESMRRFFGDILKTQATAEEVAELAWEVYWADNPLILATDPILGPIEDVWDFFRWMSEHEVSDEDIRKVHDLLKEEEGA